MARRRHRRRRFGDYVSVPLGLGKLKLPGLKTFNPLGKSVNSTDVLIGAAVGAVGGSFVRKGVDRLIARFWPTAPVSILTYTGAISSVLAGAAAMIVLKNKHKATGIFAGSVVAGVLPVGWDLLKSKFPSFFSDYTTVDYGLMTDVNPMGLLVDEGNSALSELAAYSMGNDEAYDVPV